MKKTLYQVLILNLKYKYKKGIFWINLKDFLKTIRSESKILIFINKQLRLYQIIWELQIHN